MENKILNVVCAVILKNNKVLAVKRSEKQRLPGCWEFPGGKVEEEEDNQTAIIREIEEELRIRVNPLMNLSPVWWQDEDYIIHLKPIVCEILWGDISLQEHAEFRWLSRKELGSVDWASADVPVMVQVSDLMALLEART